jgi:DUF4097 and DUF4098 domain-containing protein YvlB
MQRSVSLVRNIPPRSKELDIMFAFTTSTPVTAVVEVPAAHVTVIATDRPDAVVEVRALDASKGRDTKAAERVTAAFDDGRLHVSAPEAKELFSPSGSVEVTLQVPAGSHVRATAAGEIRGVGRLAEVVVDGSYGPIKLDEAASIRVATQDGDVVIGRLNGSGEVSTQRGDIRIAEASEGALQLSTRLGDISVGAVTGVDASLDASTAMGRISNALQNGSATPALSITASTDSGNIDARTV